MKLLRTLLVLLLSLLSIESTFAQGGMQDIGVKDWIGYSIVGPATQPFSVVYIVQQDVNVPWHQFISILPRREYEIVATYTRAQMGRPQCLRGLRKDWRLYEVQIVNHARIGTQTCSFPITFGRDYLMAVLSLPGVNWTETERRPIDRLLSEIQYVIKNRLDDYKGAQ